MRAEWNTIQDIRDGLVRGHFSAREVCEAYFERIERVEDDLRAFLTVNREFTLAQAEALDVSLRRGDQAGPLAGVPVAVKDNILVKGLRATAASRVLERYTAAYDATVVDRLRRAGALIIGKTNMDEFAMGSSTENSSFAKTTNPWDHSRVPGGSSGGSAAAVAASLAPVALGSDTGGSVRQPASFCGVVGMKPSYGRVSRYGLIAMTSSLDQIGPLATCVEDAAQVFLMMVGRDPRDATTVEKQTFSLADIHSGISGMRIGVPREYFVEGMDDRVIKIIHEAIAKLESLGATIVDVSLPLTPYALAVYQITVTSEVSTNLARYDGVRYGSAEPASMALAEAYRLHRGEHFGDEAKRRIILGTFALSHGYYERYYQRSQRVRAAMKKEFESVMGTVDCLVAPTAPSVAFALGEKFADPLMMYLSDILTCPSNIVDAPAISVPCGFTDALPVGLQIIGKPFDEQSLFRVAYTYQEATAWHKQHPKFP